MSRTGKGFTIMEAMTAMVIALVAAVGVIGVTNQGVRLTAEGRQLTRASAIAQDFAANVQIWRYADARLALGAHAGSTDLATGYFGMSNASLAAAGAAFTRDWTVAALPDSNANGVQDGVSIVLTVGWGEGTLRRSTVFHMSKVNPGDQR